MSPERRFVAGLGLAVLVCAAISFCSATLPAMWGWTPRVVLSGSMEPAISTGDVALIAKAKPGELRAGDVVLADLPGQPGRTYLHRVVAVESGGVITRGDANATNDHPAIEPSSIHGRTRLVVPLVGWPLLWITQPSPLRAAIGGGVLVLLIASAVAARPLLLRR